MKLLRSLLDSQGKHFHQGGRLEFAYPVYEMVDTFLYTPGAVTKGTSHVRDGFDLKRMMMTVVIALIPAVFMAMYNTGYQAHLAISQGAPPLITWQTDLAVALGLGGVGPQRRVGLHGPWSALLSTGVDPDVRGRRRVRSTVRTGPKA